MEESYLFIVIGLFLALDIYKLLDSLRTGKREVSNIFFLIATFGLAASYLVLVNAFLSDDFSFVEVYQYSAIGLPEVYKFAASWAGMGGSMLLFTTLVALIGTAYRLKVTEKGVTGRELVTFATLSTLLFAFAFMTYQVHPLERFGFTPPTGLGLNPLLRSPYMMLHPLTLFLGYAFLFVPAAEVIGSLAMKKKPHVAKEYVELSWLFLTIGIVLGGAWAYECLGWGGYWAWDPVETAPLVVWLLVTAYFHVPKGDVHLKEVTIAAAFALVFLAMLMARGAYAPSVHSFAMSTIGPSLAAAALTFVAVYIFVRQRAGAPLVSVKLDKSVLTISSVLSYASLVILAMLCTSGLLTPVITSQLGQAKVVGIEYYNVACFPFTLLFLISLVGCSLYERLTLRRFFAVTGAALALGALFSLAHTPIPKVTLGGYMANFAIPTLLLGLGATLIKLAKRVKVAPRLAGSDLIHVGVCLTLIGVVVSSTTVAYSGPYTLDLNKGATFVIGDTKVGFGSLAANAPAGYVYGPFGVHNEYVVMPERYEAIVPVKVVDAGSEYMSSMLLATYQSYGLLFQPCIVKTLLYDIYIIPRYPEGAAATSNFSAYVMAKSLLTAAEAGFDVSVWGVNATWLEQFVANRTAAVSISFKKIPFINFVWGGSALMAVGGVVALATTLTTKKFGREGT